MRDYFPEEPFGCPCGCGLNRFDPRMRATLNRGRKQLGRPIIIRSGCRCSEHNAAVGGKPTSGHLLGPDGWCHAVDIKCYSSITRRELTEIFRDLGIVRMGFATTFHHVDNAQHLPQNCYWVY